MIANLVFVDVKPEFVEDFKKASVLNHEGSRKEPGNIRFDVLQSADDPTKFTLYEVFADEDAVDFQSSFLSCGLDSAPNKETYEKRLGYMKKHTREMFRHGERIFTDFDTAKLNIKNRPVYDEGEYVIFKGLENLDGDEIPRSVIFTVNPIELTVITQINTSFRTKDAYILTPQAAGCQAIGCYVFEQAESDDPKPVLGPIDFAGRSKMKHFIPNEYLTLAMPWKLFLKLEELSETSVLETDLWRKFL